MKIRVSLTIVKNKSETAMQLDFSTEFILYFVTPNKSTASGVPRTFFGFERFNGCQTTQQGTNIHSGNSPN